MRKKVIIFDLDGVLFDTIEVVRQHLFDLYPGFTIDMHKELMTGNFHEEKRKITLPQKEETEEEATERKLTFSKNKSEAPMYPGAKKVLEDLHSTGYILVLNTSAFDRNSRPLLENAYIASLFDFVATAEISESKVEKFKVIEERYGVPKADILFVTDTLGDIREADTANIPTVAVTWGGHDKSYLTREEHRNLVGIVDSPSELKTFIDNY
jgi:HAD superfamily hydrolase (TIGR01509 family)